MAEPWRDQKEGGGDGFSGLMSCVKVEVAVLGSPSLISPYGFNTIQYNFVVSV